MKIKLSIIVSTYNRSRLLESCLSSLVNQDLSNNLYEIIVVDNNSTDNTKNIVDNFIKKFLKCKISYVLETRQGLSYARNAGCENAKGEYLAYIDDDAEAPENWVKSIIKTTDKIKPHILGGPIYPYYLSKKPLWFKDEYEIRSNGETKRFLIGGEYLSGSNFIIKKAFLTELGKFNPDLGMRGDELRYGEETGLMIEARKKVKDVRIYYNPELKVMHRVKNISMNLLFGIKNRFIAGVHSSSIFGREKYLRLKSLFLLFSIVVEIVYLFFYGFFFRDRDKYVYFENFVFENILCRFYFLGKIVSRILG